MANFFDTALVVLKQETPASIGGSTFTVRQLTVF